VFKNFTVKKPISANTGKIHAAVDDWVKWVCTHAEDYTVLFNACNEINEDLAQTDPIGKSYDHIWR